MLAAALLAGSLYAVPLVEMKTAPLVTEVRYRRRSIRRSRRAAAIVLDGCCWPPLTPRVSLGVEAFYDLFPVFRGK